MSVRPVVHLHTIMQLRVALTVDNPTWPGNTDPAWLRTYRIICIRVRAALLNHWKISVACVFIYFRRSRTPADRDQIYIHPAADEFVAFYLEIIGHRSARKNSGEFARSPRMFQIIRVCKCSTGVTRLCGVYGITPEGNILHG